jgi:hypothetical protein
MNQMSEWVRVLESAEKQNFRNSFTGDESWFFSETFLASGLLQSRDDLPSRPGQYIQTEKCLVSVKWYLSRLHSRLAVPKGEHSSSPFFIDIVVSDLQAKLCSGTQWKT